MQKLSDINFNWFLPENVALSGDAILQGFLHPELIAALLTSNRSANTNVRYEVVRFMYLVCMKPYLKTPIVVIQGTTGLLNFHYKLPTTPLVIPMPPCTPNLTLCYY